MRDNPIGLRRLEASVRNGSCGALHGIAKKAVKETSVVLPQIDPFR